MTLQTSEFVVGNILVKIKIVDPASLTSWKKLPAPKRKGKISSRDPSGSATGQAIVWCLMVKFGEEFITDLYKGYEAVLTRNYTQIADQLARGKYAIGIGWVLNSWQRYSGGTKDSEVST